jgi:tetratricopeptide (TPR) repeat protein
MRTQLLRGILALAIALGLSAPAFAQSIMRGTVVDEAGKPVPNATVLFEFEGNTSRRAETKTNANGEFLQVGLASGNYVVTVTAGNLKATQKSPVRQGENRPLNFRLGAGSGVSEADAAEGAAMNAIAAEAVAAMQAGNHDLAISKFNEIVAKVPTCSDCFYNLGMAHTRKQAYDLAEENFKKAIAIKPDHADAYSGLANVYNAQKKFDLAVEASTKAAQLAGAGAGGGSAEAMYNQGVTLWNAQKYAEAKVQFEAAVKADPKMGPAWYQLGMANLNLGQLPAAKEAFQGYLTNAPTGDKAAEVQTLLKQLP